MLNTKEFMETINRDIMINTSEVTIKKLVLELEKCSNELSELYSKEPTKDSTIDERTDYIKDLFNYENKLLKILYNAVGIKQYKLSAIIHDYIDKVLNENHIILNRLMSYNTL